MTAAMTPDERWRLGYRPELDGIRGVAIAIVVMAHLGAPIDGWPGVQLFFVLSGYLITSLLVSEHRSTGVVSLRGFYARRARRLLPALLALLVVLAVLGYAPWGDIAATLFYGVNWLRAIGIDPGTLGHAWSLGIEEQFYLVWPLLTPLLVRRHAVAVLIGSATLMVLARFVVPPDLAAFATPLRADGLLLGSAAALAGVRLSGWWSVMAAVLIVGIGMIVHALGGAIEWGIAAVSLLSVAVIVGPGRWLSWRPLVWLGGISYALYLWHWPLFFLGLDHYGPLPMLVTAIALAWASTRFIERPFRHVARRKPSAEELRPEGRRQLVVGGADVKSPA